jgi:hypothetical protein
MKLKAGSDYQGLTTFVQKLDNLKLITVVLI